nr:glycosyltransferase [Plesiomonas shigelloides]
MKRINPLPSLKMSPYVYEDSHYLLGADASSVSGPNIGWGGVNLTITCLSMNRVTLTEKLLNSIERNIPDFKGRVLIVDNGSKKEELEKLYAIVSRSSLNVDVVELGENYGVSGGRNRTIPHLRTPWAMFLDNDIYFISNPLPRLQKDLAQLGCHFINMPLLDSDCETLFAKGGEYLC